MYGTNKFMDTYTEFNLYIDKVIAHILFTPLYFFDIPKPDIRLIYPLFVYERELSRNIDNSRIHDILRFYAKVLHKFNRHFALKYMFEIFDVADDLKSEFQVEKWEEGIGLKLYFGTREYNFRYQEQVHEFFRASPINEDEEFYVIRANTTKILLLGPYSTRFPGEYVQQLRYNLITPQEKLANNLTLAATDRILLLTDLFYNKGIDLITPHGESRKIKNVFLRIQGLMYTSDYIFMLLSNCGGTAMEYGAICENKELAGKSYIFISNNDSEYISAYASSGTFLLESPRTFQYDTDFDLVNQIKKNVSMLHTDSTFTDLLIC